VLRHEEPTQRKEPPGGYPCIWHRLIVLVVVLCGLPLSGFAQNAQLVRTAQEFPLPAPDPAAPKVALSQWLAQLGGVPPSAVHWEINDCGEGGDGRAAPTCVEGRVSLTPAASVSISVAVLGLDGQPLATPSLFMMYVKEGQKVTFARSLAELAAQASRWRD
jgi:hypothetical protein